MFTLLPDQGESLKQENWPLYRGNRELTDLLVLSPVIEIRDLSGKEIISRLNTAFKNLSFG